MAACGRHAALYIPVSAAWLLIMAICVFMWRRALKQRRIIRSGLLSGKKRLVRIKIKALHATHKRDHLQYISTDHQIIEVKAALPEKSFFYEQRTSYHHANVSNVSGLTGQEVILHISGGGNILLKAEYPHTLYCETAGKISDDDLLLMKEKQSTLVKLFLTGCTGLALILLLGGIAKGYYSNLYIVIAAIYVIFFLLATPAYYVYNSYTQAEGKIIVRGKVTEIISTMRHNQGTGDIYYRVSDKLFLVRPIENLGTRVQPGNEVELHFIRKKNGQRGRMLYDIKC
jgi:hypothetical protein